MRVNDKELSKLVSSKNWNGNTELEIAMHHRLWQYLNLAYCEQLVAMGREKIANENSPPLVPFFCQNTYRQTTEQSLIISKLLFLVKTIQPENWFTIMELQREIGLFKDAQETYLNRRTDNNKNFEEDGAMLYSLAQQGITAPALVAYS